MAQVERLPPGQHLARGWPVQTYGPVPSFDPASWDFTVSGATASGEPTRWSWPELLELPVHEVVADLHCVTRFTIPGAVWTGIPASTVLATAPPADDVTHVMVWAEHGYSSNLRLSDLNSDQALFATHRDGVALRPAHGFPLRLIVPHLYAWKGPKWVRGIEYLREDRPGFWEARGYHPRADPWAEERYSNPDVIQL